MSFPLDQAFKLLSLWGPSLFKTTIASKPEGISWRTNFIEHSGKVRDLHPQSPDVHSSTLSTPILPWGILLPWGTLHHLGYIPPPGMPSSPWCTLLPLATPSSDGGQSKPPQWLWSPYVSYGLPKDWLWHRVCLCAGRELFEM